MDCFAARMTHMGTGAIATIQLFGDSAQRRLTKVFRPAGSKTTEFKTGRILIGTINDENKTIDQVTIGCEAPETFAIHCHGNPLIVEMIMQQLQSCGATLLTAEQLRARMLAAQEPNNTIAVEAKLAQLNAKTLVGTKILANQIEAGLSRKAQDWLKDIDNTSRDEIKAEAVRILQASQTGKLIIFGCTAVLTGPPNSGKSTLLNCLAGRQKAIVTDIKGTTRDWVEATCQIDSLSLTCIDTAGLEQGLGGPRDTIEKAAQKKTTEILKEADIVLLVLDNSQTGEKLDAQFIERIAGERMITILNKSDLPSRFDIDQLPHSLSNTIRISAQEGVGIEDLKRKILQTSGITDFNPQQPVCFTNRQKNLLEQLTNVQSKQQAASIITQLFGDCA